MSVNRYIKGTLFVALLAAVAFLAWRTTPPDANAPAQLDPSTPAAQGGFRLVQITRADKDGLYRYPDDTFVRRMLAAIHLAPDRGVCDVGNGPTASEAGATGLWVILPAYRPGVPIDYLTTARTSGNRTIFLNSSTYFEGKQIFCLIEIPLGYPNGVNHVDVTMTDHHGPAAHWRINHIPPMRHLLPLQILAHFHPAN